MAADDQTRPATSVAKPSHSSRGRLRQVARRVLRRVARPYARSRAREAEMAAALGRLEADFDHLRERHSEQIERLEELVRELVLTAESLRRATAAREDRGGS
jgi:hypothetical protein